jgi:hypothetical protein
MPWALASPVITLLEQAGVIKSLIYNVGNNLNRVFCLPGYHLDTDSADMQQYLASVPIPFDQL